MDVSGELSIRGLTVDYGGAGGVRALQALDLEVDPGSFHAILGPSGCGKSTLIKVLAGLIPRTAGEARRPGDGSVAYVPRGIPVSHGSGPKRTSLTGSSFAESAGGNGPSGQETFSRASDSNSSPGRSRDSCPRACANGSR
ncbi:MAG: ATP-binding cassette domain-containing protein [Dehalococcoidia bacterium]|nr:ATP-binding cassette domain-containing protein [Dehalococcoidia bacterium]